jgi:MFS family permease
MTFQQFHLFSLSINSLFLLFIGCFVFARNKKSITHKAFLFFSFSLALWNITTYFCDYAPAYQALGWNKIAMGNGILLGGLLLLLSLVFPAEKKVIFLPWKILFFFNIIIIFLSLFTDLIIKGVEFYAWGTNAIGGKLYFLTIFWAIFCIVSSLYLWVSKLKKSKGLERTQMWFLGLGIISFSLSGVLINVLLPSITGSYQYSKFGPYFSLLFSIPISIGITRYHLFGIEVILTEILVGVIGILLIVQIFTAPSILWRIVNGGIFVLFCIFGYLLIRGVFREIRRREEVEKISQAKSEFISITSHQLRTPLSAIKGYLSMVLEGTYGGISERVKKVLENVYQSNERLIKLVNAFLDVSRIELGREELKLERVSIEDLISETISEIEIEAKKKNLYLKFERPKIALPKILIDRGRIKKF